MSTKRLSKKKAAVVAPQPPQKSKKIRVKKLGTFLLLVIAVFLALFSWGYRLFDLGIISGNGGMGDLVAYYHASEQLLANQEIWVIGKSAPFGPPSTLVPFLPFVTVPLTLFHFIFSLLNVALYVLTWLLVAKWHTKRFTLKNSFWWLGLAFMAWSFPVSYSLGAGNPMGLITWGIYSYLATTTLLSALGLALAVTLKLFPVVLLLITTKKRAGLVRTGLVGGIAMVVVLLSLVLWPAQWGEYVAYLKNIMQAPVVNAGLAIQNQSIVSLLGRLGLDGAWTRLFALGWSLGMLVLVGLWFASAKPWKKLTLERRLQWGMRLLAAILLIHPTPWQYYHALFIPYVLLRVMQRKLIFVPALLLLSFNGAWLPHAFPGASLLASSQWLGLLWLMLVEFWISKQSSIDQIIKDRGFFNHVASS
jgi:hypothetical protein